VLVSGVLVAAVTTLVCPVPSARLVTLRVGWALALVVRTVIQLLRASASVSWAALRYGSYTHSAVVAVPLRHDADRLVRGAVQLTGLSPGSMVLEIDREHSTLYVHSLPVRDKAELEQHRRQILASEDSILRAFGGTEYVATGRRVPGDGPAGGRTRGGARTDARTDAGARTDSEAGDGGDTGDGTDTGGTDRR
ncbi:Na+/H+ antiporter subunit E, partial [Streptomyces oceani]